MEYLRLLSLLALVGNCLAVSVWSAEAPHPSVDSVLAKWEEASQKCRSLDAELTVFRYERLFLGNESPVTEQGRFYYEAPNLGCYRIAQCGCETPSSWFGIRGAVIWKGDETVQIDGMRRTCYRYSKFSSKDVEVAENAPRGGLFSRLIQGLFWPLVRPQNCVPLAIDIRAADVRQRFDIAIERIDKDGIELKATPKRPFEKNLYGEIRLILNPNTYMTWAVEMRGAHGTDRIVYVLKPQKVNQRPSDRDQLMNPDLSGLDVSDLHLCGESR